MSSSARTQADSKIFREYDIRGVADRDFSDVFMPELGAAIGTFLKSRGAKRVAVGYDCRQSSTRLKQTLLASLRRIGLDTVDVGMVPTPLLYFSIPHFQLDGGIMVTGSHNPPEYNGFKICSGTAALHGSEIQEIGRIYASGAFSTGNGKHEDRPVLSDYLDYVVKGIEHPLNLKVVVDSGNGMGGIVGPELYRRLGCDVVELFSEPDGTFPNHHPDPTVLENLEDLRAAVAKHGAVAGIGFDGDADRIGVVDASGSVLFGDELLVLYARDVLRKNPKARIISEVKASHRLFNDIRSHGGVPIQWKTGHSLIKAKMKEEGALLAGEMSGHVFFKDRYFGFDDAIYAGARLLEILAHTRKTPRQLLADLPSSFATPEIRVDCPDELKFKLVDRSRVALQKQGCEVNTIDGARVEFPDGWGLVRASNTQPVLVFRFEAETEKRLSEIRALVENVVREQRESISG